MAPNSDVCLILEGTYPFVKGGVAQWVHRLISSLHDIRFSLLVILPVPDPDLTYRYELPPNVTQVEIVYIQDPYLSNQPRFSLPFLMNTQPIFRTIRDFYGHLERKDYSTLDTFYHAVLNPDSRTISPKTLFSHKKSWAELVAFYERKKLDCSFLDFFWAFRASHLPVLKLADSVVPPANLYHSLSTGYAGLASAMAHLRYQIPMIITEHGIYTNERRMEIDQSDWIFDDIAATLTLWDSGSPFKKFWVTFFEHIAHIAYRYSDAILTLYESNRLVQIHAGADPQKTQVIPNGIDLTLFRHHKTPKPSTDRLIVGFVGRVVSIKDVKTFIRAAKIVKNQFENCQFQIIGPMEEEAVYFQECVTLAKILELGDGLIFTGSKEMVTTYPELDIVVLTSISEAQPLTILEANYCGVPCVATDVGSCSELLNGSSESDIGLGPSGLITPVGHPQATADAILTLLRNPDLRAKMGQSGTQRVQTYYNERDVFQRYRDIYQKYTINSGGKM